MNNKITYLIYFLLALLYLLHIDFWFWNDSRLILGLPVGLLYHLLFCLTSAILLTILVTRSLKTEDKD